MLVPAEVILGHELVDVQDTIWVFCLIVTGLRSKEIEIICVYWNLKLLGDACGQILK